jgi:small subunit ribosomal protein S20
MANKKSTKKRVVTNSKAHMRNVSRKSDIKTATKNVLSAISKNDLSTAKDLLVVATSKIARAGGKKVFSKNTASRKISRLSKKVSKVEKKQMEKQA